MQCNEEDNLSWKISTQVGILHESDDMRSDFKPTKPRTDSCSNYSAVKSAPPSRSSLSQVHNPIK
jgi:hypothetical protein